VQSVRPGDIARNRVPENRLECAPIPIQYPVRRRQLALPRFRVTSAVRPKTARHPHHDQARTGGSSATGGLTQSELAILHSRSVARGESHTSRFAPRQW
jgi:hypothetical protein